MPEDVCTVCSGPASNRCSACKQVSYCSREHQKQDWRNHKYSCRPFEASILSASRIVCSRVWQSEGFVYLTMALG